MCEAWASTSQAMGLDLAWDARRGRLGTGLARLLYGCPGNASSALMTSLTACATRASRGLMGAHVRRPAGLYKAVNCSSQCTVCKAPGHDAGTVCFGCPPNTSSPRGSDTLTYCICLAGMEGSDWAACTACTAELFIVPERPLPASRLLSLHQTHFETTCDGRQEDKP